MKGKAELPITNVRIRTDRCTIAINVLKPKQTPNKDLTPHKTPTIMLTNQNQGLQPSRKGLFFCRVKSQVRVYSSTNIRIQHAKVN